MIYIENFLLTQPEVALPIVLLVIGLGFRVVVDHEVTVLDVLGLLVVLPLEMKLLALSFFASFAISSPSNTASGTMLLFTFTFTAMFTTLLWKKAQKQYERAAYYWCGILTCFNGLFSYFVVAFAISKLSGVSQ